MSAINWTANEERLLEMIADLAKRIKELEEKGAVSAPTAGGVETEAMKLPMRPEPPDALSEKYHTEKVYFDDAMDRYATTLESMLTAKGEASAVEFGRMTDEELSKWERVFKAEHNEEGWPEHVRECYAEIDRLNVVLSMRPQVRESGVTGPIPAQGQLGAPSREGLTAPVSGVKRWDESYLNQIDTYEGGAADHIRECYAYMDRLEGALKTLHDDADTWLPKLREAHQVILKDWAHGPFGEVEVRLGSAIYCLDSAMNNIIKILAALKETKP